MPDILLRYKRLNQTTPSKQGILQIFPSKSYHSSKRTFPLNKWIKSNKNTQLDITAGARASRALSSLPRQLFLRSAPSNSSKPRTRAHRSASQLAPIPFPFHPTTPPPTSPAPAGRSLRRRCGAPTSSTPALPDELLDDVLRRVGAGADGAGSKRDLDACALVCRRWSRLERASRRRARLAASGARADEVLRLVAERFPPRSPTCPLTSASPSGPQPAPPGPLLDRAARIGEHSRELQEFDLLGSPGTTDEGLIGLVKNCGQSLVSLSIATCVWLTDASLHAVGSHCPNLEILSLESDRIQNGGVISIAKGCRLLKTLKLQCVGASDEALDAIGSFCLLLEILSLNNFERFTDRSLSSIAKGCKNLTDLILTDCQLLTDRSLEFVARSCKKLARVKINGCQSMDTAALAHIGRWCPGLLELSLIYCPRIQNSAFLEIGRGCSLLRVSDAGVIAIAESCSLQKLNLCGCQLITDSGLTAIARGCPDLISLDISVLRMIGDMALAEIGEGCPKLKEIALSHCPEVTNVGLGHLVRGCQQLESCQMVYCRQISSAGVATIVSSCSKLKKLLVEEWKVSERTRRRAGSVLTFLCTGL
ncbi:hypothetical protein PR202_ga22596 [Eleusine coracana subsp. coracana]|uniref:F-box/LRR-repeat protein 15-like leucin rich repeat domain-containing protein n=1 Tax=Eleusine coracana subsp. coracana TaxID=191504 RepID=A0AAV5D4F7_ELECO|nr:hypothetical protein PR202_ga22596 [Eleusine coracana subsp. coracana]